MPRDLDPVSSHWSKYAAARKNSTPSAPCTYKAGRRAASWTHCRPADRKSGSTLLSPRRSADCSRLAAKKKGRPVWAAQV